MVVGEVRDGTERAVATLLAGRARGPLPAFRGGESSCSCRPFSPLFGFGPAAQPRAPESPESLHGQFVPPPTFCPPLSKGKSGRNDVRLIWQPCCTQF